jgi:DNA-binding response OmpR family regulator
MRTILLVEDSLTESAILTGYLQQAGLSVVSVRSGEEARETLHRSKPDLIVLDVILPGQSGFELCHELKMDPQTNFIPVVICSTKGTYADQMWGSMLGADAYIPKPVKQQDFLQTVQQLMRKQ